MIDQLVQDIKQELLTKSRVHTISKSAIMSQQQQHRKEMLHRMTDHERAFWLSDAHRIFTPQDIRNTQTAHLPWGLYDDHAKSWPMLSSGTTGGQRLRFPYAWSQVFRAGIGPSRCLDQLGITSDDCLFCYDSGNMSGGTTHVKMAFSMVLDGHLCESQVSTVDHKVKTCLDHGVTFVCAVPRLLEKMARWLIQHKIRMPLRAVLSTGYAMTQAQSRTVSQAFECPIIDLYGLIECGNVSWTCTQGQQHVNIDLVEVAQQDNLTVFTGLIIQPIFRYHTGDTMIVADPDCACLCGSHLPVVSQFHSGTALDRYKFKT